MFLVQKTRRILELPLNNEAARVIRAWHGIRKCAYVFYNPETGDQFKDLWLGLKSMPQSGTKGRDVAHLPAHVCFATHARRSRPSDREGTAGPCEHNNDHAVRTHESRCEEARGPASGR